MLSCGGPALVADLSARPPRGTFWCHVFALPPDRKGLSRLWVPLFGMIFPLNFVLCRVTFPVLFINSSRLSCLAEPGLGAPLSSYLERALYKLIYREIDRIEKSGVKIPVREEKRFVISAPYAPISNLGYDEYTDCTMSVGR